MKPLPIRVPLWFSWTIAVAAMAICVGLNGGPANGADDSNVLPQYRLIPGQELQFHEQMEYKEGNGDTSKTIGTSTDWQMWVARANSDGSWRLVFRTSTKSSRTSVKDSKQTDQPAEFRVFYCDLFPDGRIPVNDTPGVQDEPEKLFPRLPGDEQAVKKGWAEEKEDGFVHYDFTADPQHTSGNAWAMDEVLRRTWDKIYDASWRSKFFFDRQRGLIQHVESEFTWGNGFDEKGTETIEFVAILDHDEPWTKRFAAEADRYFKIVAAYQDLMSTADRDAEHAEATVAEAETELKEARATMTLAIFTEQLERQLSDHKNQARWTVKRANELAELKGKPAAEWKNDDLDGKTHALADYRGKVVVLDFWYRGCGWCIRAMPQVQQLSDEFKDEPVAILGMNNDQDEKDARFVVDAMQLTYPVLKAPDVPQKYMVHGFPTLVIIDQQGTVRDVHVGYTKTLRADVAKIINDLLAKK